MSSDCTEDLGLSQRPGDAHYRAFVGPPADYDLIAAMTFSLLAALGLRQHHRLLDVGCGSLRVGRLLIPYLNRGGYVGIEPERWLVQEGIDRELGASLISIKKPRFVFGDSAAELAGEPAFDYVVAQSVFSHTGRNLLRRWIGELAPLCGTRGALIATFLPGAEDPAVDGWIYPGCVQYRPETFAQLADDHGLAFRILDWAHPRQTWFLTSAPGFDAGWLDAGSLSWNAGSRARAAAASRPRR